MIYNMIHTLYMHRLQGVGYLRRYLRGSYTGLSLADITPELLLYILGVGLCTGVSAWGNTHLVNVSGAVSQVPLAAVGRRSVVVWRQASLSSIRKLCTVLLSYYMPGDLLSDTAKCYVLIRFPKPLGVWRACCIGLVVRSLRDTAHALESLPDESMWTSFGASSSHLLAHFAPKQPPRSFASQPRGCGRAKQLPRHTRRPFRVH